MTGTGPHDTALQGQVLTIGITPSTTILVGGQPSQSDALQSGQSVSLRIVKSGGGYIANEISTP